MKYTIWFLSVCLMLFSTKVVAAENGAHTILIAEKKSGAATPSAAAQLSPVSSVAASPRPVSPLAIQLEEAAQSFISYNWMCRPLKKVSLETFNELDERLLSGAAKAVRAYLQADLQQPGLLQTYSVDVCFTMYRNVAKAAEAPDYLKAKAKLMMAKLWQMSLRIHNPIILTAMEVNQFCMDVLDCGLADPRDRVDAGFICADILKDQINEQGKAGLLINVYQQILKLSQVGSKEYDHAVYLQTAIYKSHNINVSEVELRKRLQQIRDSQYLSAYQKRNIKVWLASSACESYFWNFIYTIFCCDCFCCT